MDSDYKKLDNTDKISNCSINNAIDANDSVEDEYNCFKCSKIFVGSGKLQQHITSKHKEFSNITSLGRLNIDTVRN